MGRRLVSHSVITQSMQVNLTNLLPEVRQRLLAREYRFRLGVVILAVATALVVVAGIFLIPTYIFVAENVVVQQTRLASIDATFVKADGPALSKHLTALSGEVVVLLGLKSGVAVTKTIASILTVPRPGVVLSEFLYTAATGKNKATFSISGTATTRDTLRNYQLALQSMPFIAAADLPISAYAKDSDIAFTITTTLTP